jgi:DivIVA domain-containing protein
MSLGVQRARFSTVFGGYRRDQVDTVVSECERWRRTWSNRRVENTSKVAEADRRVEALETRVAELEEAGAVGSSLAGMANELLDRTEQVGDGLQKYALLEAEAEQEELTQAREAAESARTQAEHILAEAERERDDLRRSVEESHRQVDQYLRESKSTAEEKARALWDKARDRLREPLVALERVHEQQRMVLEEVEELEELIDTSWRRLIGD